MQLLRRPLCHLPCLLLPSQATCLEHLANHAVPGAKVLDVGSGSGIMCAYLGRMVAPEGKVIGVDIYPSLIDKAKGNLDRAAPDLLRNGVVELRIANGWLGAPHDAPFDAIHVGAAPERVPPELVAQLRPGGRMLIPVGAHYMQELLCIDKQEDGTTLEQRVVSVAYVPLQEMTQSQRAKLQREQHAREEAERRAAQE